MEVLTGYVLPSLWACLACVSFGVIFNIHGVGILICGLGAGLGWMVYLVTLDWHLGSIVAAFLAALAIAVFSECMARLRRCPVTGYLLVALLPLVPGAGIYYTMRYCVMGNTGMFLSTLLSTLGMAGALSVGAMIGSALMRGLLPRLRRAEREKKQEGKS